MQELPAVRREPVNVGDMGSSNAFHRKQWPPPERRYGTWPTELGMLEKLIALSEKQSCDH